MSLRHILLIIFLSSAANAEIIQGYWVRDFNTLQPIDAVDVSAHNGTLTVNNVTDANGRTFLYFDGGGNFTVDFTKTGYETRSIDRNISSNDTEDVLLNPQSTSGIIRLHVVDLTGGAHTICVFYLINGRLKECVPYNETGYIQIFTSTNYSWRPVMQAVDMVSTPSNFANNYKLWLPLVGGLLFAAFIVIIGIILIYRIWVRRKK